MIEIHELTKRFGNFTAVDRINFRIEKGEILGFLGPNGAGKTTTIKMITGLLKITSGKILIKGMDAERQRTEVKKIMGYMSQKFSLYPLLTARENIEFFAGISGLPAAETTRMTSEIQERIKGEILNQQVADLPPGIRQRVALSVCLLTDPDIILLDEPTSGVDPEVRRDFWFEIYNLKKRGKTILVSTHNLDEVEYADRVIIIHRGRIILEGKPTALKKRFSMETIEEVFKRAIVENERESARDRTNAAEF
jgi:ABC-2 type transport system ATP-binding protein